MLGVVIIQMSLSEIFAKKAKTFPPSDTEDTEIH